MSCPTCRKTVEEMPAFCSVCTNDVGSCGMVHHCGMVVCARCFKTTCAPARGEEHFKCPKCKSPLDCGIQKLIDPSASDRVIMNMRVHFKSDDDDETSLDAKLLLCAQFELLIDKFAFTLRTTSPEGTIEGETRGCFGSSGSVVDFFVTSVKFKIPEWTSCIGTYKDTCFSQTCDDEDRCRCWWICRTHEWGMARDGYMSLPLRIDFAHTTTYRPTRDSLLEDGIRFSCPMSYRPGLQDHVIVKFQNGDDDPRGTTARIKRRRVASNP